MSVAPFSSDDEALVSTFVRLERKSRDAVPMTDMVIAGKYLHYYFKLQFRLSVIRYTYTTQGPC